MVKKSTLESILKEEMSEMWSVLTNEDKRIITDNFRIHTFKKNEVIYSEGEEPKLLMCLLKGKVKIYKDGVGGRSQIIRLIRPVQYFGYRAHFANENYVTAASAFETSTIGTLPMSIVEEQLKRNNQFALFFIKELATNLGISGRPYCESYTETYTRKARRVSHFPERKLRAGTRRFDTEHIYGSGRSCQSFKHDYF